MLDAKPLLRRPSITLSKLMPDLDGIARRTGFIQRRSRKFSAHGFLLTVLKAVAKSEASFNQMAVNLAGHEPLALSRQALHRRLDDKAIGFLQAVLDLIVRKGNSDSGTDGAPFGRILIEDATQFRMHPSNHAHYRAVANNSGPTSGGKVDFVFNLLDGQPLLPVHTEGHVQDRTLGPRILDLVKPRDLVLRDLGYFDLKAFQVIEAKGAWWLSRLHGQAGVVLPDGRSLEALLTSTDRNVVDCQAYLTVRKHPVRLVAFRSSEEVASRRRQEKKTKRKLNGTNASKASLIREGWTIYVTNLPVDTCPPERIFSLYRQRWAIEIQFRAWKQSLSMRRVLNRITSLHHLRAMLLAAIIHATLLCKVMPALERAMGKPASLEKAALWLCSRLKELPRLETLMHFDHRHLVPDRRKRRRLSELRAELIPLN